MRIELLINCEVFLRILKDGGPEELYDVLGYLDRFPHLHVFTCDETLNEIYNFLFSKRRDEKYRPISRWLDRTKNKGETLIVFSNEMFHEKEAQLILLTAEESQSLKGILLNNEFFQYETAIASLNNGMAIRDIHNIESVKRLLILLSLSMETVHAFIGMLSRTFDKLIFDEDIEASIKTLEAGFEYRKKEILYHLYCIDKEIPVLLKNYSGDKEIGKYMSIPCSPEKTREVVEHKLVKRIDGKEIKCELHTKMRRIGNRKPDRIYFSPRVDEHILSMEGIDMIEKIYIYKIGEHV